MEWCLWLTNTINNETQQHHYLNPFVNADEWNGYVPIRLYIHTHFDQTENATILRFGMMMTMRNVCSIEARPLNSSTE